MSRDLEELCRPAIKSYFDFSQQNDRTLAIA
ncbi:MAG: hypothetical protein JWO41_326 [Candidatus Saccharibacteria bacterium]|nr:hypothetical protein [Candidatus Saccharibacteria bacterium]